MKILGFLDKALPVIFWILLMFGFDMPYAAIMTVIAAVIHESGHLIMIYAFSEYSCKSIRGCISGLRIKTIGLSYTKEALIAAGGPLINIVIWLIALLLPLSSEFFLYIKAFGIFNLLTAASNLLPIEGYDGYKILYCLLSMRRKSAEFTEDILSALSFLFSAIMCFLSLYVILKIGEGYWIYAVFSSVLLSSISKRQKNSFCEN